MLDFSADSFRVEIALLEELHVVVPKGQAFDDFNFKGGNSPALEKVEKGK